MSLLPFLELKKNVANRLRPMTIHIGRKQTFIPGNSINMNVYWSNPDLNAKSVSIISYWLKIIPFAIKLFPQSKIFLFFTHPTYL